MIDNKIHFVEELFKNYGYTNGNESMNVAEEWQIC
jgi:hypothetical protein